MYCRFLFSLHRIVDFIVCDYSRMKGRGRYMGAESFWSKTDFNSSQVDIR